MRGDGGSVWRDGPVACEPLADLDVLEVFGGQQAHGTVVTHDLRVPLLSLNQLESIPRDGTGGSGDDPVRSKGVVSPEGTSPQQETDQKQSERTHGPPRQVSDGDDVRAPQHTPRQRISFLAAWSLRNMFNQRVDNRRASGP